MNYSGKILLLIIIVFVLQAIIPGFTELFIFNPKAPNIWMFVTNIFLHGSTTHLLFNGLALLMFAPLLENRIGSKNFLILFLASGIFGNILYYATILLGIIPPISALGASGAVYGILGTLSVIFPELIIFVFFFPMPIRIATVFWIILEFFGSFNASSGIGSAAHLGGLLLGIAFGIYYKNALHTEKAKVFFEESEDEKWDRELRGE